MAVLVYEKHSGTLTSDHGLPVKDGRAQDKIESAETEING